MASDGGNKKKPTVEMESLNLDDLDIEELEHRVELASALPGLDCYINCNCDGSNCDCNGTDCSCNAQCGTDVCAADCGNNCIGNCTNNCVADCGCNCVGDLCAADILRAPPC